MNQVKVIGTILVVLLVLSSCGSSSDTTLLDNTRLKDRTLVKKVSCEFNYLDGEKAPTTLPAPFMRETSFGKILDFARLESVFLASGQETVRFLNLSDAQVFKTNFMASSGSCYYSQELPEAPADLMQEFNDSNDRADDNVLGLYLPVKWKSLNSVENKAAILVRKDSDKWTLVHEFTHHLFSQENEAEMSSGAIQGAAYMAQLKMQSAARAVEIDPTPEKLEQLAAHAVVFGEYYLEVQKRFPLEEMTIEVLLGANYLNGRIKNVSELMMYNGQQYVQSSADKAVDRLALVKKDLRQVLVTLAKNNMSDTASFAKVSHMIRTYGLIEAEIAKYKWNASQVMLAQSLLSQNFLSGIVRDGTDSVLAPAAPTECAHEAANEDFERKIKEARQNSDWNN